MKASRLWAFLPLLLILMGCSSEKVSSGGPSAPTDNAEKFLKWSMNRYAGFKSYQSTVGWRASFGDKKETQDRKIAYTAPNLIHLSMQPEQGGDFTLISNANSAVEYMTGAQGAGRYFDVPPNIASMVSQATENPAILGSPFYQFFGGSDNLDHLASLDKAKIQFGEDGKVDGEPTKTVTFYGAPPYGHMSVVIGTETGLVRQLTFDNDPIVQQGGTKGEVVETFTNIKTDAEIPASTFEAKAPKGITLVGGPPVPLGQPAPDVQVTSLDGQKVKLSSLKGQVVMIDFWATWCGPCKEGLPVTDKLHKTYGSKGLKVLAVSNETQALVSKFVKENKYAFPPFLDKGSAAAKAYGVTGIPCLVIIDANGNLSSYSMGLRPEGDILAKLQKAGLKI